MAKARSHVVLSSPLDFQIWQRYKLPMLMRKPSPENLLKGLTEPQKAAVTHQDGPLLVLLPVLSVRDIPLIRLAGRADAVSNRPRLLARDRPR